MAQTVDFTKKLLAIQLNVFKFLLYYFFFSLPNAISNALNIHFLTCLKLIRPKRMFLIAQFLPLSARMQHLALGKNIIHSKLFLLLQSGHHCIYGSFQKNFYNMLPLVRPRDSKCNTSTTPPTTFTIICQQSKSN